ncbi:MAG: carboxypeptidase regulatory-like domain-containing protein, partial [Bacteroidetes bacterium]|nr:carboxypeptidase regulatory-like domain-containing protein [Bacteroidota bacterium]
MVNILSFLLLALLLLAAPLTARAQYDNVFFRLKPSMQKGMLLYHAGAYDKAIPYIEQALQQQPDEKLSLMLAHAYALTGKAKESVRLYRQIGDPQALEAKHLLAYTLCLQNLGHTDEARSSFQTYMDKLGETAPLAEDLGKSDLYRNSIRYSVHPLSINTRHHEFAPLLTAQGIYFISDRKSSGLVRRNFSRHAADLDVYQAHARSNTRFVNTSRLGKVINSSLHEGPTSVDSAGTLYFSRSDRNGKLSLWIAKSHNGKENWTAAEQLHIPGAINLFHPAVSANGQLLFFASDMPGGLGGTDIYFSVYLGEEGWSEPVNAGPQINTPGQEVFPVLHENKLYFSSDGRIGMGRLDIYEAFISGTTIIHVRNMGAPLNSSADDFSLVWLPDGSGGYFASNRKGSRGGDDLYRLDYHVITLEGTLRDSTNNKPLAGAEIRLQNPDGSARQAVTNDAGAYSFTLYPGENYELSMEAKNYRTRQMRYSTFQGKQYGKRQLVTALERKTKVFVLGNVRLPDNKKASQAQLVLYDRNSHAASDTLQANDRGNFEAELDNESNYIFFFQCDGNAHVAAFETSGSTEASLSHYLNVKLQAFQQYKVQGQIEGADPEQPS